MTDDLYKITCVTDYAVFVLGPDGREEILDWGLLRDAARQEDGELRAAYVRIYKAARQRQAEQLEQETRTKFWALLTDRTARIAAAVDQTKASGSVLGMLSTYLRTAEGGWPETRQAWEYLLDAVRSAAPKADGGEVRVAAKALIDAALAAGWNCHPSRKE